MVEVPVVIVYQVVKDRILLRLRSGRRAAAAGSVGPRGLSARLARRPSQRRPGCVCLPLRVGRDVQYLSFSIVRVMGCDDNSSESRVIDGHSRCGRTVQAMQGHPVAPNRRPALYNHHRTSRYRRQRRQGLGRRNRRVDADRVEHDIGLFGHVSSPCATRVGSANPDTRRHNRDLP